MQRFRALAIVPIALSLAILTACSKSNGTAGSLTAPSPAAAPAAGGASIRGTVLTGATTSSLADPGMMRMLGGGTRVTISVNGTSISVTSDDDGNFVLENVPPGTVTLTISGPGFTTELTLPPVNTNDALRITVRVSGSSATLDEQELSSSDNKVELEGEIGSVALSSSGGTFVVGRAGSTVMVDASTSITKGGTTLKPNDLTAGLRVHVKATRSGSTLLANRVIVQNTNSGSGNAGNERGNGGRDDDDGDDEDDDEDEAEVSGVITSVPTGGCPASNSFTVGTTTVVTNASTRFDDTTCASLAKGDNVEVEGTRQTDGSILAREVEKKSGSGSGSRAKVSGSMSARSGSCPTLSFKIENTTVTTSASTKYDDGLSCSALTSLSSSTKLEAAGVRQGDGSILADEIGRK